MKVAIITETFLPKIDGVTHILARLLEHLKDRGDEAIVVAPKGALTSYANASVYTVPGWPLPFYPELRMLYPWGMQRHQLASFHPDVIHIADPMMLGMPALHAAQRLDVPLVAAYHTNLARYAHYFKMGALAPLAWSYQRYIFNHSAATLCPSHSTAEALCAHGFKHVEVWSHGVDTALFTPARRSEEVRRRLGVAPDTAIMLYVGRLSHEKNVQVVAEVYRAVARQNAHLVVVGDGPARTEMEAQLAGLPVTFTGYLKGEELAATFASADLFFFPSTTETFGLVVQEAMASGLPVVGSYAEGVRDLITPNVTGFLATPGQLDEYIDATKTLLDDAAKRQAMGQAARTEALKHTWSDVMNWITHLYERVIAAKNQQLHPEQRQASSSSQLAIGDKRYGLEDTR